MNQQEVLSNNSRLLDEYEKKQGLPPLTSPGNEEELQEYLCMDRDVIESLTPERCISVAVRLSQFSFYLQRCINKNKAIIKFADHEMNKIISKEIGQYDKFTKHDTKVYQISMQNSAVKELLKIRSYAEQVVERFDGLSNGIKNLSYVVSLMYKNKIGDRNE